MRSAPAAGRRSGRPAAPRRRCGRARGRPGWARPGTPGTLRAAGGWAWHSLHVSGRAGTTWRKWWAGTPTRVMRGHQRRINVRLTCSSAAVRPVPGGAAANAAQHSAATVAQRRGKLRETAGNHRNPGAERRMPVPVPVPVPGAGNGGADRPMRSAGPLHFTPLPPRAPQSLCGPARFLVSHCRVSGIIFLKSVVRCFPPGCS